MQVSAKVGVDRGRQGVGVDIGHLGVGINRYQEVSSLYDKERGRGDYLASIAVKDKSKKLTR